jgi:cyclopropane fatty-acyl-phospholipid synthase-like methyltransferase
MAAGLGLKATGIDAAPKAIELAASKARARNLEARFLVANALDLPSIGEQYDTVLDCGLFHVLDDEDRGRFVESLREVVAPTGHYRMLCFSDEEPGDLGPRRVSQDEIRASFGEGWRVESIEASEVEGAVGPAAHAWLSDIVRA